MRKVQFIGRKHPETDTETLALTLGSGQAGMKGPQEGWASLTRQSDLTAVPDLRFLYLPGCHTRDFLEVGGYQVKSF